MLASPGWTDRPALAASDNYLARKLLAGVVVPRCSLYYTTGAVLFPTPSQPFASQTATEEAATNKLIE